MYRKRKAVIYGGAVAFMPSVDGEGKYNISFRADTALKNGINTPNVFQDVVNNHFRVGWTHEQYKSAWDSDLPDDPLEIRPPKDNPSQDMSIFYP